MDVELENALFWLEWGDVTEREANALIVAFVAMSLTLYATILLLYSVTLPQAVGFETALLFGIGVIAIQAGA